MPEYSPEVLSKIDQLMKCLEDMVARTKEIEQRF
jgi:hypothetical protein